MNITDSKNGRVSISDEAANMLSEIDAKIDELTKQKNELRKQILDAMIENHIDKCSTENGITFTQIIPANISHFDTDAFIMNEPEDVVSCFTSFDEIKTFDEEKFEKENPELYEKYCNKEVETNVDTDKLEKALPIVFKKYYSEEESDKPVTLRVGKKRGVK